MTYKIFDIMLSVKCVVFDKYERRENQGRGLL